MMNGVTPMIKGRYFRRLKRTRTPEEITLRLRAWWERRHFRRAQGKAIETPPHIDLKYRYDTRAYEAEVYWSEAGLPSEFSDAIYVYAPDSYRLPV